MPDLRALVLRTDPRVHARGAVVKGMYYARSGAGPNDLVAFRLGCGGVLEARPFLVLDFRTGGYLLDAAGDGCADGTGVLPGGEVDPADFLPAPVRGRFACAVGY
jgi:hypothetical protein